MTRFRCAGVYWYEEEVESFITQGLVSEIPRRGSLANALLFKAGQQLIAVAAHRPTDVDSPGEPRTLKATHMRALAIALTFQGTRLSDGTPLSTMVLHAAIRDALGAGGREPLIVGLVAAENVRSRRLCAREGFVEDTVHEMVWSEHMERSMEYVLGTASVRLERLRPKGRHRCIVTPH